MEISTKNKARYVAKLLVIKQFEGIDVDVFEIFAPTLTPELFRRISSLVAKETFTLRQLDVKPNYILKSRKTYTWSNQWVLKNLTVFR